jgi:hypothetical protein
MIKASAMWAPAWAQETAYNQQIVIRKAVTEDVAPYLYDENGDPYVGVYRSPGSSTTPAVFGMVTNDRSDVVELLDAAGNPIRPGDPKALPEVQSGGRICGPSTSVRLPHSCHTTMHGVKRS